MKIQKLASDDYLNQNYDFWKKYRIELIKDKKETKSPENRPPYIYQVPLNFIPGVGGKTIEKLLDNFETEMNILHKLSNDDIEAVVGEKIAKSALILFNLFYLFNNNVYGEILND